MIGVVGIPNAARLAVSRAALRRTLPAAGVVGGVLTIANSGSRLAGGDADGWLAARVVVTFAVPWLNATFGYIAGRHHGAPPPLVDGGDGALALSAGR